MLGVDDGNELGRVVVAVDTSLVKREISEIDGEVTVAVEALSLVELSVLIDELLVDSSIREIQRHRYIWMSSCKD